jgi:hypothetical protein
MVRKRPRRPIMSAIRMRRSECRARRPARSKGADMRDENASRRSTFEKPTKARSTRFLTAYQMTPQSTEKKRKPKKTRRRASRSTVYVRKSPKVWPVARKKTQSRLSPAV